MIEMTGQIDEDVDAVGADPRGDLGIRQMADLAEDVAVRRDGLAEPALSRPQ